MEMGAGQLRIGEFARRVGVAPELLRALLEMAGEAVNLAVFDADSMVLLYREQGPKSVTISSRLGRSKGSELIVTLR